MAYATRTEVPVDKSRMEIEKMLRGAKALRVVTVDESREGIVMFMMAERLVKMRLALTDKATEQNRRTAWRALGLVIKARLEAISSGIETVEQAWLPHVVLPDGRTMSEWAEPALKIAYERGEMPGDPLRLPSPPSLLSR